jgi:citrate lyase alpha subunit
VVRIYDNDNESEIGSITEAQLDLLQEEWVEETVDVQTFNISAASIDSLEMNGGDQGLIAMLRQALGARSSMELRFDLD